jgi:hypothetical protein
VAAQPCTPTSGANPCKTYATACNATGTQTTCVAKDDIPDRTSCGSQQVCVAGACVPSLRTVSGAFKTTYTPDDGSRTTVSSPPPDEQTATAILVPDGTAAGYTSIPITLDANQSFSLPGVPAGSYFLQLDAPTFPQCPTCPTGFEQAVSTQLIELRVDSPDLTTISAARPDLARETPGAPFRPADASGLAPWVSGDSVLTVSSQGLGYGRLSPSSPAPAAGATSVRGIWLNFDRGLPDASKGDVFFAYQRSTTTVGTGDNSAMVSAASRFTRITDLTLTQSTPGLSLTLTDPAPQTGAIRADFRYSQFAALAPSVHPSAVPGVTTSIAVVAAPHSIEFQQMPSDAERTSLLAVFVLQAPPATDFDYGTLHYGEFLDTLWKTYRSVVYSFDVPGTLYAGGATFTPTPSLVSFLPPSADSAPIVPMLGPPTQPRIEGRDAFPGQNGVGLQPTFAWSPPAIGQATSYQVTVADVSQPVIAGETRVFSAIVYSGRSFKVPPGILKQGRFYAATISARSGPWDTFDHAPFQKGIPFHTADCVTGVFSP